MTSEQLFILAVLAVFVTPIAGVMTTVVTRGLDRRERMEVAQAAKEAASEARQAADSAARAAAKIERASRAAAKEASLSAMHTDLKAAVLEGTAASASAEKEANHANVKIEQIQKVLTKALNLPDSPMTALSIDHQAGNAPP